MNANKLTTALLSGLAGAAALTVLHETVRRVRSDAPRMDTLGRRAIAKSLEAAGLETPPEDQLQAVALDGDIVANTLYYSLACLGRPSLARGAVLGAAAGLGALVLAPHMGLGTRPRCSTQVRPPLRRSLSSRRRQVRTPASTGRYRAVVASPAKLFGGPARRRASGSHSRQVGPPVEPSLGASAVAWVASHALTPGRPTSTPPARTPPRN